LSEDLAVLLAEVMLTTLELYSNTFFFEALGGVPLGCV